MKKRCTEEQINGFLREADAGLSIKELCRKHGFSEPSYYAWRSKFGGTNVPVSSSEPVLQAAHLLSHRPAILTGMNPTPFYLWWVPCERTGKMTKTRHRMTVEVALERHPGAKPVEGSAVIHNLPETPEELMASCTSAWRRARI